VRILVDTDVLLDVALDRAPHVEAAAALLDYLEQHPGAGFMAWHTVSNFYYLAVSRHGRDETRDFLLELSEFIGVAATDTESLRVAGRLQMRDFEDAMQVAAAQACRGRHAGGCGAGLLGRHHRHAEYQGFSRLAGKGPDAETSARPAWRLA